jgi:tRNA nucleotidyltransferase/poly(A) polymerase
MPRIYKVGGCVRDKLLGIDSKDIDFTFVLDDLTISVDEGFKIMESWLKDNGFDGVIYKHWDRGTIITCFNSNQIKIIN